MRVRDQQLKLQTYVLLTDEELEGDQFHLKYLKSYCRTEIESYL